MYREITPRDEGPKRQTQMKVEGRTHWVHWGAMPMHGGTRLVDNWTLVIMKQLDAS